MIVEHSSAIESCELTEAIYPMAVGWEVSHMKKKKNKKKKRVPHADVVSFPYIIN